ncbi:TetR/AcrR family transcriptional regulator [Corynebacterium halotolerans]|uniref:TetR/AcrR family transcriptional regulator n=1 Tax=Corynebacterium halotolerans TaxID=225326 RepID=UPI003CF0DB2E
MARTIDQEKAKQKRREIADTAARLFATRGYENTSVATIAREVGISSASVFYYFRDKAALFRAAFEQDLAVAEEIAERARRAEDAFAAILDIVAELGTDAAEPGADGMVAEIVRRAGQDPELVALVAQTAAILREALAGLIARGIREGTIDATLDPGATASWLQAVIDGAYLNAVPGRNPEAELRRTARGYLLPQPMPDTPKGKNRDD